MESSPPGRPILIGLPFAALLVVLLLDLLASPAATAMLGVLLLLASLAGFALYWNEALRARFGITREAGQVREPLAGALAAAMILLAGAFVTYLAPAGTQLGRLGPIASFQERIGAVEPRAPVVFWDDASIARALAGADVLALRAIEESASLSAIRRSAGTTLPDGRVALVAFFEASADEPEAIAWLERQLARGLDPSAPIRLGATRTTAPLWAAVDALNVEAALLLLEAGASPHAYETFTDRTVERPRFGWPIEHVLGREDLGPAGRALAEAMAEAGAVVEENLDGLDKSPSPGICEGGHLALCEAASAEGDVDWCRFVADGRLRLSGPIDRFGSRAFVPEHLIAVRDGFAWLRGRDAAGDDAPMLLRAGPGRRWDLHFRAEQACQDPETGRYTVDCWRGFELRHDPATGQVTEIHPTFGLRSRPLQTAPTCP
jgi:hypothetical protein